MVTLTCSLLVEEILDSASSSPLSSFFDFQNLPSRRNRWCSSSSSQAFFQPMLRFTCSRWMLTVISWMFSEGIQALLNKQVGWETQNKDKRSWLKKQTSKAVSQSGQELTIPIYTGSSHPWHIWKMWQISHWCYQHLLAAHVESLACFWWATKSPSSKRRPISCLFSC